MSPGAGHALLSEARCFQLPGAAGGAGWLSMGRLCIKDGATSYLNISNKNQFKVTSFRLFVIQKEE